METVRFKVERHGEFIEIELVCGEDHASFTAPADSFRAFDEALHGAILEAEQWNRMQSEVEQNQAG